MRFPGSIPACHDSAARAIGRPPATQDQRRDRHLVWSLEGFHQGRSAMNGRVTTARDEPVARLLLDRLGQDTAISHPVAVALT